METVAFQTGIPPNSFPKKVLDKSLRREHDAYEEPLQKKKFQLRSTSATTPEARRKLTQ